MESPLLDRITSLNDLRQLPEDDLPQLAEEIRAEILDIVSRRGGHLASNLGVVELTIALLRVFDPPHDRLVWDTSHQAYVYKLLTGRRELMQTLRQDNGCCGFLNPDESPYDAFAAGHAGTAVSAALGMAAARDLAGTDERVVAVVGDAAISCGSSLEGLNNVIETTQDMIVVLNDNRMSIDPNVGGISRYLNSLIAGEGYNRFRSYLSQNVPRIPAVGPWLKRALHRLQEGLKALLLPGSFFEGLGLRYIGPLNGHDLPRLCRTFEHLRKLRQPLLVHVLTEKGRGYEPASKAPEVFHGTGEFDVATGAQNGKKNAPTFSSELGRLAVQGAERDPKLIAIVAGMCKGTGLETLRDRFPKRIRDVGIAEEHAVVFAAGLAASGAHPMVAIYASFMQRAMDYVYHDVCMQNLPVVFCLDRAGAVPDGPTHHGIYDLAFWRTLPNLTVLQPADSTDFEAMFHAARERLAPVIIRYPRSVATPLPVAERQPLAWGKAEVLRQGADVAIWGLGREADTALAVAAELAQHGVEATVVNPRFAFPFDRDLAEQQLAAGMALVCLEDHCVAGGFGSTVRDELAGQPGSERVLALGWPQEIVTWGTIPGLRQRYGLDVPSLVARILAELGKA
jgi:1-deoxy-D-xylulose-5-phosphate synthase